MLVWSSCPLPPGISSACVHLQSFSIGIYHEPIWEIQSGRGAKMMDRYAGGPWGLLEVRCKACLEEQSRSPPHLWNSFSVHSSEKAMAPHSSALAWKIPWAEEPGGLQPMGSLRVGHDWATSLSLFTFMHWRRKWQPTPALLPRESQGEPGGLPSMGSRRVGHDWSDLAAASAVHSWSGHYFLTKLYGE